MQNKKYPILKPATLTPTKSSRKQTDNPGAMSTPQNQSYADDTALLSVYRDPMAASQQLWKQVIETKISFFS